MENSTTEYKRELTDGFEREAVAFLNTLGGEIFVGVDNDGNIVGLENADKTALAITDRLKNNILPAVLGYFQRRYKNCWRQKLCCCYSCWRVGKAVLP